MPSEFGIQTDGDGLAARFVDSLLDRHRVEVEILLDLGFKLVILGSPLEVNDEFSTWR